MSDILQKGHMFTLLRQAYRERSTKRGLELGAALEAHLKKHDLTQYDALIHEKVVIDIVRREKSRRDEHQTRFHFYMHMTIDPECEMLYRKLREYYFWVVGPGKIRVHPDNGDIGIELLIDHGEISEDHLYPYLELKPTNDYLRCLSLWLARLLEQHPFDAGEQLNEFPDQLSIDICPIELDAEHQTELDSILAEPDFDTFARRRQAFGDKYQDERYIFLMSEGAKLSRWFKSEHSEEYALFCSHFGPNVLIVTEAYHSFSEFGEKQFAILHPTHNSTYRFRKIMHNSCALSIQQENGDASFINYSDCKKCDHPQWTELCEIVCRIFPDYPFQRCGDEEWYL